MAGGNHHRSVRSVRSAIAARPAPGTVVVMSPHSLRDLHRNGGKAYLSVVAVSCRGDEAGTVVYGVQRRAGDGPRLLRTRREDAIELGTIVQQLTGARAEAVDEVGDDVAKGHLEMAVLLAGELRLDARDVPVGECREDG